MVGTLAGGWTNWTLCGANRKYGTVQNLPYAEAVEFIMAVQFKGATGKGQQRELVDSHVAKLKREMRAGNFTPTAVSAALDPRHRDGLTLNPDMTFSLTVDSQDPLLHTDGGHRFEAIRALVEELEGAAEKAKDPEEKAKLAQWAEQAKALPVTVTVYFDGDPQRDFVNLQAGRAVDASHLKSLALQAGADKNPALKVAFDVARRLHKDQNSPFHNEVKFDSAGNKRLPIATLTATGGSDIATSLAGLAKVGLAAGKDAQFLADAVTFAYQTLKAASDKTEGDDGILEPGKPLTPISNDGTKGSSTMLTGVGVCLAYRLIALGKDAPDATDLEKLLLAAAHALNKAVKGNFAGPVKRALLGKFAKEFFADVDGPRHQGIPTSLLKTLSCSTFDVKPLPKEAKPRKPKKAASTLPAVDGPPTTTEVVTITNEPVTVAEPQPNAPWEGGEPEGEGAVAGGVAPWEQNEIAA